MNTPPTDIDLARMRLEALYADTEPAPDRDARLMTSERQSIRTTLNELHRLNEVVSAQKNQIQELLAQKARAWKHVLQPSPGPRRTGPSPQRKTK
jgi:hypothetical protein